MFDGQVAATAPDLGRFVAALRERGLSRQSVATEYIETADSIVIP